MIHVGIRHCQETTGAFYEVSLSDLLAYRRGSGLERYRKVAMWLAMKLSSHGSSVIGRAFGRDHTTVLKNVRNIDAQRADDALFAAELDELMGIAIGTWRGLEARGLAEADLDPLTIARRIVDLPRGPSDATFREIRALALAVIASASPHIPSLSYPTVEPTHG